MAPDELADRRRGDRRPAGHAEPGGGHVDVEDAHGLALQIVGRGQGQPADRSRQRPAASADRQQPAGGRPGDPQEAGGIGEAVHGWRAPSAAPAALQSAAPDQPSAPSRRRPPPDRGRSRRSPPRSARAGRESPRSASAPALASPSPRYSVRDVDDPAGVDDIIGRVEDAALVQPRAVLGRGQLVVGAAGDDRRVERGDAVSVEDRAERVGAEHVGLERTGSRRARRPCRRSRRRASWPRAASTSAIDSRAPSAAAWSATPPATLPAPCIAMCRPVEAVLAERALDRRLDAEEHAERRVRPGIAADRAALDRKPGDEFGLAARPRSCRRRSCRRPRR